MAAHRWAVLFPDTELSGLPTMPQYRSYFGDREGKIKGTLILECEDDTAGPLSWKFWPSGRLIALDDDWSYLQLTPQLTLHLGLVVHELATNSRKYGALSTAGGRLEISWSTTKKGNYMLALRCRSILK